LTTLLPIKPAISPNMIHAIIDIDFAPLVIRMTSAVHKDSGHLSSAVHASFAPAEPAE
jgi:hypothetical protein